MRSGDIPFKFDLTDLLARARHLVSLARIARLKELLPKAEAEYQAAKAKTATSKSTP